MHDVLFQSFPAVAKLLMSGNIRLRIKEYSVRKTRYGGHVGLLPTQQFVRLSKQKQCLYASLDEHSFSETCNRQCCGSDKLYHKSC